MALRKKLAIISMVFVPCLAGATTYNEALEWIWSKGFNSPYDMKYKERYYFDYDMSSYVKDYEVKFSHEFPIMAPSTFVWNNARKLDCYLMISASFKVKESVGRHKHNFEDSYLFDMSKMNNVYIDEVDSSFKIALEDARYGFEKRHYREWSDKWERYKSKYERKTSKHSPYFYVRETSYLPRLKKALEHMSKLCKDKYQVDEPF